MTSVAKDSETRAAKQRWVIKLGSALLAQPQAGLNLPLIASLADVCVRLQKQGIDPVLVSSGAISRVWFGSDGSVDPMNCINCRLPRRSVRWV